VPAVVRGVPAVTPSDLAIIERALIGESITSEEAEQASEALGALRERDWAVRVLDAWFLMMTTAGWDSPTPAPELGDSGRWFVYTGDSHWADFPDAARLAAAEAVWATLPEAERASLGERP
jgi:hypothetical protein